MMGEKRFTVIFVDGDYLAMPYFFDNGEEISDYEVVDLLNEQQATISRLEEEIKRLKCMNNQLERRLDYSIAYDMGECE